MASRIMPSMGLYSYLVNIIKAKAFSKWIDSLRHSFRLPCICEGNSVQKQGKEMVYLTLRLHMLLKTLLHSKTHPDTASPSKRDFSDPLFWECGPQKRWTADLPASSWASCTGTGCGTDSIHSHSEKKQEKPVTEHQQLQFPSFLSPTCILVWLKWSNISAVVLHHL